MPGCSCFVPGLGRPLSGGVGGGTGCGSGVGFGLAGRTRGRVLDRAFALYIWGRMLAEYMRVRAAKARSAGALKKSVGDEATKTPGR